MTALRGSWQRERMNSRMRHARGSERTHDRTGHSRAMADTRAELLVGIHTLKCVIRTLHGACPPQRTRASSCTHIEGLTAESPRSDIDTGRPNRGPWPFSVSPWVFLAVAAAEAW